MLTRRIAVYRGENINPRMINIKIKPIKVDCQATKVDIADFE